MELSGTASEPEAQSTAPGSTACQSGQSRPSELAFRCRGLSLAFTGQRERTIFTDLDLDIPEGQFLTILGGSGVGKSTLLRMLAGIHKPTGGSVWAHGELVRGAPPGVVMVFQDYSRSLLPWRNVLANVMLGIERKMGRKASRSTAREALAMVGLADSADLHPHQLSGGMQQRAQIARALATQPRAILMDEPFGALDAMTKATLQDQVRTLQSETGATFVFVTHDIEEAVYLGDRALVLAGSPAVVSDDVEVNLGGRRDQLETRATQEFLEVRGRLHAALQGIDA